MSAKALRLRVRSCSENSSLVSEPAAAPRSWAKEWGAAIWGRRLPDCFAALWAIRLPAGQTLRLAVLGQADNRIGGKKGHDGVHAEFGDFLNHQVQLGTLEQAQRQGESERGGRHISHRSDGNGGRLGREVADRAVIFDTPLIAQGQLVADLEAHDVAQVVVFRAAQNGLGGVYGGGVNEEPSHRPKTATPVGGPG